MHNKSETLRQPIEEDPMSEDLDDSGSGDVTPHLPGPVGVMVGFPLNVHSNWNLHGWHLDDFSFRCWRWFSLSLRSFSLLSLLCFFKISVDSSFPIN